jgi:O-antigen ligase
MTLSIILSPAPVYRDIFEIIRPFLYVSAFVVGFKASNREKKRIIKLSYEILISIILILLVNQLFKISPSLAGLYSSLDFFYFYRFSAIFSNPYDLAFAISFILSITISHIIINGLSLARLGILFFAFIAIILSQSRTGAVSCALVLFLYLLYIFYTRRKSGFNNIAPLLVAIIFFILYVFYVGWISNFQYLLNGIAALLEGRAVHSLTIRIDQLRDTLSDFLIFGHGPGFGLPEVFLESQYALYSHRYGVPGTLLLLFIICTSLFAAIVNIRKARDPYILGGAIWLSLTPVLFMTNAYMDIARTSFLYFITFGVLLGVNSRSA